MDDTVMVRPRHGLILDGIPTQGAAIPKELADQWIADRMVERVEAPEQPKPPATAAKPKRR